MATKRATPHKGDEAGGFNPDRPARKRKAVPAIGPMPTDDPYNKARADLKRRIEEVADKWRMKDEE